MKIFGYIVGYSLVAGTIYRVSNLLAEGLGMGWQGWAIGLGVAGGLALSAKFIFGNGFLTGLVFAATFIICLLGDIWMNELEVVRILRPMDVSSYANYYGVTAAQLRAAIEMTGIIVGFVSSILGFLILLGLSRLSNDEPDRAELWFKLKQDKILGGVATAFGGVAMRQRKSRNMPIVAKQKSGTARPKTVVAWEELTALDVPFILNANRQAIQDNYGVSNGTAALWKRRLRAGETPWPQSPGNRQALPAEIDVEVREQEN